MNNEDHLLQNYRYDLPEESIAQEPAERRDQSRLLVLDRASGNILTTSFAALAEHLPPGALLVANNSKVIPARIHGTKVTGGKVEFLLLSPPPLLKVEKNDGWSEADATGLLKASKAPKEGTELTLPGGLKLRVLSRGAFGRCEVRLRWKGELEELLRSHGEMPLPPYIKRNQRAADLERYQTTYAAADKAGSVAAPTAGLHFTPELREELAQKSFEWAEVTLFVGYGTFSPVRCADIREHAMHHEYIEVSRETAQAIARAKREGRPVVAIGTTSARTLEGMFANCGKIEAFEGTTNIFIRPGHTFQVVDKLLTNFHLPESSLVIMVSALAGRQKILEAYHHALQEGFRFFSYGDAMLIS